MIIIGVTGNTGAGKSTVSTIIKNNLNAIIINADEVANSIMEPGNEFYDKVLELFGDNILEKRPSKKGKIHKPSLSKILFSDAEKREKMNKLTFKYVGKEFKRLILENKNEDYIILDVPLLYEGKFDKICNYVIAVTADEKTKIDRVKIRDRIHPDQAKKRLDTQNTDEFFKENADFVIENNQDNRYINLVKDTLRVIHKIKKDVGEKKEG